MDPIEAGLVSIARLRCKMRNVDVLRALGASEIKETEHRWINRRLDRWQALLDADQVPPKIAELLALPADELCKRIRSELRILTTPLRSRSRAN